MKKSLPTFPTGLVDENLTNGDKRSSHGIYDVNDDDNDDDMIADDEDDYSNNETTIATPGQNALSKLLAMARPA